MVRCLLQSSWRRLCCCCWQCSGFSCKQDSSCGDTSPLPQPVWRWAPGTSGPATHFWAHLIPVFPLLPCTGIQVYCKYHQGLLRRRGCLIQICCAGWVAGDGDLQQRTGNNQYVGKVGLGITAIPRWPASPEPHVQTEVCISFRNQTAIN